MLGDPSLFIYPLQRLTEQGDMMALAGLLGLWAAWATPSGNMNGEYVVSSGAGISAPRFNTDYASKGHEYFDVWSPEIATRTPPPVRTTGVADRTLDDQTPGRPVGPTCAPRLWSDRVRRGVVARHGQTTAAAGDHPNPSPTLPLSLPLTLSLTLTLILAIAIALSLTLTPTRRSSPASPTRRWRSRATRWTW